MLSNTLLTVYVAIVGLIIGSAINAIVWRLYVGRSWVKGRSMCPECKHELKAKDLVPVISWLMLRGRCRYCKAKIHWQYPVVELATALLFGLSAYAMAPVDLGGAVRLVLWLIILTLLIILAVYDARWMILPDKIMVPAILIALVYVGAEMLRLQSLTVGRGPLLAALVGGGAFYALVAATKGRAMGGGDIKLVFLMGLLVGLKGLALALMFAFDVAAIVGLTLIALKLRKRRDHIAFGPFLVAGTIITFLYGHDIVQWYLHFNGLA